MNSDFKDHSIKFLSGKKRESEIKFRRKVYHSIVWKIIVSL